MAAPRRPRSVERAEPVALFVIDQFEEVFTLGIESPETIARLRIDLADLIENRIPATLARRIRASEAGDSDLSLSSQRYKALVSFREDFLPAVEGWKRDLPSIMRNRLRLLPMSGKQAFEAVHTTAPHLADEAVARKSASSPRHRRRGLRQFRAMPRPRRNSRWSRRY